MKKNSQKKIHLIHFIPLALLIIFGFCAYFFLFVNANGWDELKQLHTSLKRFHTAHPLLTPLLFMMIHIAYTVLMIPGIAFLSLISGFLFPQPLSTLYVVFSATVGTSALFFAARAAFREILMTISSKRILRFEEGFRRYASNYMLFLRLVPVFPYKMVNLAGAFFDIPYIAFAWTTFFGMIPSVYIYTEAGKGLSAYLESPNPISLWDFVDPILFLPLFGLALLALVPVFFKKNSKKSFPDA